MPTSDRECTQSPIDMLSHEVRNFTGDDKPMTGAMRHNLDILDAAFEDMLDAPAATETITAKLATDPNATDSQEIDDLLKGLFASPDIEAEAMKAARQVEADNSLALTRGAVEKWRDERSRGRAAKRKPSEAQISKWREIDVYRADAGDGQSAYNGYERAMYAVKVEQEQGRAVRPYGVPATEAKAARRREQNAAAAARSRAKKKASTTPVVE
jgi:hypothetical protein